MVFMLITASGYSAIDSVPHGAQEIGASCIDLCFPVIVVQECTASLDRACIMVFKGFISCPPLCALAYLPQGLEHPVGRDGILMEPGADGIRNSHEYGRRPRRGGYFPDADRMEAVAWEWASRDHMIDGRQLGKGPPFVVDQVRIEDMSCPAIEDRFFEDGAVDARGTEAAVELAFETLRVDDLADIGGIAPRAIRSPFPSPYRPQPPQSSSCSCTW